MANDNTHDTDVHKDSDLHKGATESDQPGPRPGSPNLEGQLGHRTDDPDIKDADSDFPEPGPNEEHSGQRNSSR